MAVLWTGSMGLSQRRAGGLESAAWSPANGGPGWAADGSMISRKWRARWAADGAVISRERRARWAADGGVISCERRAGWAADSAFISRERRAGWAADGGVISRKRWARVSGWHGIATGGGGYLLWSAGLKEPRIAADFSRNRRAGGLAVSGLAALMAIPPNSHADLTRARAEGRVATSLPRDKHKQEQTIDFSNTENKTRWRGAAYC